MTRPAHTGFFQTRGRRMSLAAIVGLMLPFFSLLFLAFLYPLLSLLAISVTEPQPGLANYVRVFQNPVYATVLLRTLRVALLVSVLSLVLAFPVASMFDDIEQNLTPVVPAIAVLLTGLSVAILVSAGLLRRLSQKTAAPAGE